MQTKRGRTIPTETSIDLLCFYTFFLLSICYCLFSLLISPGSAGLLIWSIADILLLLELFALCMQLREFHLGIHRHWMLQFSIFPCSHSTQKSEPKATHPLLCTEWKWDKREGKKPLMIVKGHCVSQPFKRHKIRNKHHVKYKTKPIKT